MSQYRIEGKLITVRDTPPSPGVYMVERVNGSKMWVACPQWIQALSVMALDGAKGSGEPGFQAPVSGGTGWQSEQPIVSPRPALHAVAMHTSRVARNLADGRCLRFSRVPVPGGRRLRLHRKHAAPARSECRVVHVSAALPAEGAGPGERQRAGWAQWSATVAIYPGGCS